MHCTRILFATVATLAFGIGAACNDRDAEAEATLQSAPAAGIDGTLTFTATDAGVRVRGTVRGLEAGPHGFHIHETGDCSGEGFKSAGGHFAPQGSPHGSPEAAQHHAGDLGNIVAGTDGVAKIDLTAEDVTLSGHASALGRAIVIHAKADDMQSQPSGAAGDRVACGIIQKRG